MLFFMAFHVSPALAGYKVAVLKNIHGQVLVQKQSTTIWISAKNNMPLYAKDTVMTKKDGEALIVFNKGHTVKIRSFTTIQLKAPRPPTKKEPQDAKPVSDIMSTGGRIFAKIKKSVDDDAKFEISTPTAIVGVRGTKFSVHVKDGGDTVCSVSEGSVEMQNDAESVLIHEAEQVFVSHETGDIPDMPSPMSDEEKKEWEPEKDWMDKDGIPEGRHDEKKDKDKDGPEKDAEESASLKDKSKEQSTQDDAAAENLFKELDYSPVSSVTTDTDFIKNLEAENLGNVFDPGAESSVIPPPSPEEIQSAIEDDIEGSILQQDGIDNAQFDEETFTQ